MAENVQNDQPCELSNIKNLLCVGTCDCVNTTEASWRRLRGDLSHHREAWAHLANADAEVKMGVCVTHV